MNLSEFKNKFSGQPVFIVGRGPSLVGFDFSLVSGRLSFAHNDSVMAFRAMVWYVTDNVVIDRCRTMPDKPHYIVAGSRCRSAIREHGLAAITALVDTCYFDRPLPSGEWIYSQYTGITGCLYLAWLARAKVAYLLGVDAWAYKDQYYFNPKEHHPNRALERDVVHADDPFAIHVDELVIEHIFPKQNLALAAFEGRDVQLCRTHFCTAFTEGPDIPLRYKEVSTP